MKTAAREDLTFFLIGVGFVVVMPIAMQQKPGTFAPLTRASIESSIPDDARSSTSSFADSSLVDCDDARASDRIGSTPWRGPALRSDVTLASRVPPRDG